MRMILAVLLWAFYEVLGLLQLHVNAESTTSEAPFSTTTIYGTTYSVVIPANTDSYWGAKPTTVNGSPAIALLSQYQSSYLIESAGTTESIPGLAVIASMDISMPSGQYGLNCKLTVQVGDKTVSSLSIDSNSGDFSIKSNSITISGVPGFTFMEVCSSKALSLVAYNIVLLADPQVVTITPTPSSTSTSASSSSTTSSSSSPEDSSTRTTETSTSHETTAPRTTPSPQGSSSTATATISSTSGLITPSSSVSTSKASTTPSSSAIMTSSTSTSSTSYQTTVSVDLAAASLVSASTTTVAGAPAVVMTPSPSSTAEIALVVSVGDDTVGNTGALSLEITPADSPPAKLKRASETCGLLITMDGTPVYEAPIAYDAGTTQVVTESVVLDGDVSLSIQEVCEDVGIPVTISNLALLIASDEVVSSSTSGDQSTSSTASSSTSHVTSTPSSSSIVSTIGTGSSAALSSNSGQTSLRTSSGSHTQSSPTGSSHSLSSDSSSPTTSGTSSLTTLAATGSLSTSPTVGSLSGTASDTAITSPTSVPGFPPATGSFIFFGCVGSSENYPTFDLTASSAEMDIEMCNSACSSRLYSGVYDTDCYCGDTIDNTDTSIVSANQCNTPCPGNRAQFCGGLRGLSRERRQVVIPNNILLTVYANSNPLGGGSGSGTPGSLAPGLPTANITETVLITSIHTVLGVVSVDVITQTTIYCPLCPKPTDVACVASYCATIYVFEVCSGSAVLEGVVFVRQQCSCPGGWAYQPATCHDTSCGGKVVYKPVPWQSGGDKNSPVYRPQTCDQCPGGLVFIQTDATTGPSQPATAPPASRPTGGTSGGTTSALPGGASSFDSSPSSPSITLSTAASPGTAGPSNVVEAGASGLKPAAGALLAIILPFMHIFLQH